MIPFGIMTNFAPSTVRRMDWQNATPRQRVSIVPTPLQKFCRAGLCLVLTSFLRSVADGDRLRKFRNRPRWRDDPLRDHGSIPIHPPPPDERPPAKLTDRPTFCDLAVKHRWRCIACPLVHCIAYGQTWHHGPITGLCGAVRCVMWWHRSARRATIPKRA